MAIVNLSRKCFCDKCNWVGMEFELEFNPFNPICKFNRTDRRLQDSNFINFREKCPKCGSEEIKIKD